MKKYVFFICLIPLLLTTLAFASTPSNTFPLFGKLIILDPGHGGVDPGSIYKDEYEKTYNLDFARALKNKLETMGATVIMTRDGDYDLSKPNASRRKKSDFDNRIKLINEDNPDLYLSLHMNYLSDSKYYGSQVFYSKVNDNNEHLASSIQTRLNDYFDFQKDYKVIGSDKYMYGKITPLGVLIEYGFLSSYKDRSNLKSASYKDELTETIALGIIDYFT